MTEKEKLMELLDNIVGFPATVLPSEAADYLIESGVRIPVRCKDCVCAEKFPYEENVFKCTHPQLDKSEYGVYGEDYCSYGERREENG